MKSPITTHILDVSLGRPASQVPVELAKLDGGAFHTISTCSTDPDGRAGFLPPTEPIEAGVYRLTFRIDGYFAQSERDAFYPWVEVTFRVQSPQEHHHVPLLLSPFGYSTYRGS